MSSKGTDPNKTELPSTKAPVKQFRFSNPTCSGPTYGTRRAFPSAVLTSLFSNSSSLSWITICSGIQKVTAPVSTRALTVIGLRAGVVVNFKLVACRTPGARASPRLRRIRVVSDVGAGLPAPTLSVENLPLSIEGDRQSEL